MDNEEGQDREKSIHVNSDEKSSSGGSADGGTDNEEYPQGLRLTLITLGLCLAVFLVSLDRTIVTTAIPQITDDFHSQQDYGWYGSAYLITTCAFQAVFGRVFSLFSVKWSYVTSLAIFELGSLLCGVAQNSVTLIVGRAIAGLGSAGLVTGSFVVAAHSVPLRSRPIYIAAVGMLYSIGAIFGPIIGGAFTTSVTWRWCFFLSLPVGGFTLFVTVFFFHPKARNLGNKTVKQRLAQIDVIGNILLLGASIMFFLALEFSNEGIPWSNSRIIGLLCGAGVTLIVFTSWQLWRGDDALIPPRIVFRPSFAFCLLNAFFLYSTLVIQVYFLPVYFQAVRGYSAVLSGVDTLAYLVSSSITTLVIGAVVQKTGLLGPPTIAGSMLATIGSGLIIMLNIRTSTGSWIGYLILTGIGIGMAVSQPFTAASTIVDHEDIPLATAAVAFAQTLGGAVFLSVCETILTNRLREMKLPGINVGNLIHGGATHFQQVASKSELRVILRHYTHGLHDVFIVAVVLCGLAFLSAFGMAKINVKAVSSAKSSKEQQSGSS